MHGYNYGASVHVTSRINRSTRLIAYCALFVIEVSDASMLRCISERQLPIQEHAGAVQCTSCQR